MTPLIISLSSLLECANAFLKPKSLYLDSPTEKERQLFKDRIILLFIGKCSWQLLRWVCQCTKKDLTCLLLSLNILF